MQIVVFLLGNKYYGLKSEKVLEIRRKSNPTIVPNAPAWVEGLVNLRGEIVTIVNTAKLLQLDDLLCYNKFIILDYEEEKIGLVVTEVYGVTDISEDDIQKFDIQKSDGIIGIVKLDENLVNMIDINSLLKNEG